VHFLKQKNLTILQILILQARNTDSNQTPEEYWLLRFPFSLHFAWALALIGMSVNGFFYKLEIGSAYQVVLGVITILAMAGIGFKMIYKNGPLPNYVVPTIISVVLVSILHLYSFFNNVHMKLTMCSFLFMF
jgi:hypothetical protein